jgi:glycosyltransferase involved in cell wall biosynthesis
MQDELMRCREELALTNQVHFTGPLSQDQLICLLDRARWFLYPVREPEAFGLAPLEAMARGVPAIVGEPPGGMADYVESLRNGFMLGQSDVEHLAATMRTACVDLALRDRMVANCVKTAHQYSWAEFTDRVNAFFSDACESVV